MSIPDNRAAGDTDATPTTGADATAATGANGAPPAEATDPGAGSYVSPGTADTAPATPTMNPGAGRYVSSGMADDAPTMNPGPATYVSPGTASDTDTAATAGTLPPIGATPAGGSAPSGSAPAAAAEGAIPGAPPPVVADGSDEEFAAVPASNGRTVRENVLERERAEFGGIKFGSAFFGWLTAMGLTTILIAIVAGAGLALGLGETAAEDAADGTVSGVSAQIGTGGVVAVLVILFVSYLAGGYVAGRMARFGGAKQGFAVWLWALVIAVVLGVAGAIAGPDVLGTMNAFPRIPLNEGTLTTAGIITAVLAVVVPLIAALLGGQLGMRYHRRVDRAGLGR